MLQILPLFPSFFVLRVFAISMQLRRAFWESFMPNFQLILLVMKECSLIIVLGCQDVFI